MIQIYNTLTRQKEAFKPIEEGKVSMYVCGPTVYNYIHIGNARSTVSFDTIRRYFEYRGYDVNFVSNFTDVDDKIIRVANETGMTAEEVAKKLKDFFTATDIQKTIANDGIDHPFIFNEKIGKLEIENLESGIKLSVETDNPAVVIYTGNYLQDIGFKKHSAICFETQLP